MVENDDRRVYSEETRCGDPKGLQSLYDDGPEQ